MVLHKVSTSPFIHMDLQQCLARLQPSDGLVLTQNAVYAVLDPSLTSLLADLRCVYLLKEDAQARAVQVENPHVKSIDYAEFVELSLEYTQVMSW